MKKWYPRKVRDRFCSPCSQDKPESLLFGTLPSFLQSLQARFFRKPYNANEWITACPVAQRSDVLRISWIGHSTFLIQTQGKNIITDPVFSSVSPIFPRLLEPGIAIDALPPIDYVVISHNHRDHMDAWSLSQIKKKNKHVCVLVPSGDKQWFDRRGYANARECVWWDGFCRDGVQFTFLPALHWSQRGLFDKNRSLWGSWMISAAGMKIYFAGDTAYGDHFAQIARDFFPIDIALLPIGPCEPRDWMRRSHISCMRSVQAFQALQAQHFIPMHWGTFPLGNDQFDEPIIRLQHAWSVSQDGLQGRRLHIVKAGQPIVFDGHALAAVAHEHFEQQK